MSKLSDRFLEKICSVCGNSVDYGTSMWASIDGLRSNITDLINNREISELRNCLINPANTKMYYGVDELYLHDLPISQAHIDHDSAATKDALHRLTIIRGLSKMYNPEGGELYTRDHRPPEIEIEPMLEALDQLAGVPIRFPNPFSHEFGLETSRGIASPRAVAAIYQALRIRDLATSRVLEIGGGMGRTAFYASTFGISDYTLVDLPITLAGQAAFLALTLGEHRVRFQDDPIDPQAITLLRPDQLKESRTRWKLAINVDSMPEMDKIHAQEYVNRLEEDGSLFLSINHEANNHAVFECAPITSRVWRNIYYLRPGYIEELYDFNKL